MVWVRGDLSKKSGGTPICLWPPGGLTDVLVWDRQAGIHGHGGRPTGELAGFCGFEPGRRFAN